MRGVLSTAASSRYHVWILGWVHISLFGRGWLRSLRTTWCRCSSHICPLEDDSFSQKTACSLRHWSVVPLPLSTGLTSSRRCSNAFSSIFIKPNLFMHNEHISCKLKPIHNARINVATCIHFKEFQKEIKALFSSHKYFFKASAPNSFLYTPFP